MKNFNMDFTPEPPEAKKFGITWIKYRLAKYPQTFIYGVTVPIFLAVAITKTLIFRRDVNSGRYVPNVLRNDYIVVRPDSWLLDQTPKRFRN